MGFSQDSSCRQVIPHDKLIAWAWEVLRCGLRSHQRLMLLRLAAIADDQLVASRSLERLAEDCSITPQTARLAIIGLANHGLITVERAVATANRYRLQP